MLSLLTIQIRTALCYPEYSIIARKSKKTNLTISLFVKTIYLCIALRKSNSLSHGVMVTHLVLVQAFKVRILMGQLIKPLITM